MAGMPATYLTTPADVMKTRLQVEDKHNIMVQLMLLKRFSKKKDSKHFSKVVLPEFSDLHHNLVVYELLQRWLVTLE